VRFTKAYSDVLSFRVRFVRAADTRWRYLVHSRMTPQGSGPQGQQAWTLSPTDAQNVLNQMQQYRGYMPLLDQVYKVANGQTRFDQSIESWPLGQTLLLSAGITPGIFEGKNGLLGIPGTKPTDRELLVFLDADTVGEAPRSARRGD